MTENKNVNGVDRYVPVGLVKKMLGLIQVSVDDGDGFDRYEWLDFVEQMPSVDAVPVAWIEDEIKELNEMDNLFSTLTANLLSAMLRRWKERGGNADKS